MKTPRIYIGALAVFCIAALVIGTTAAAAMTQKGSGNILKDTTGQFGPEKMIERLEHQGVDVTEVKSALQNGDTQAVKEWLQSYREAHQSEMVKRAGKGPMTGQANGERMLQILDNLTAQGYEVLALRTAVESGDYETAHTLMQEFRTAHPDACPARGEGAGNGHIGGQRGAQNNQ
jgi:type IV pilus biogenesis protein CpaD/CtpE